MAADNTGKHKLYENGAVIYGPAGSGQNLNVDLQKNTGDELDAIVDDLLGADLVLTGLLVQSTTGLAVEVTAGSGFVSGQRVKQTTAVILGSLTANATGLKIYAQAGTPFTLANRAWPVVLGFTSGALTVDQLHLATVNTDGSGTTLITDARLFMAQLLNGPTATEKAALLGTGVTAPSGSNKFVVNDDVRLQGLPTYLVLKSPNNTQWKITITNDGILEREAL